MKVPNAEKAVVDIRKLTEYCLSFDHPTGKHKAVLFRDKLGLLGQDAEALRTRLLEVVRTSDAVLDRLDRFGQRYRVDFVMEWNSRRALVRSGWIVEMDLEIPKLTSCYPL